MKNERLSKKKLQIVADPETIKQVKTLPKVALQSSEFAYLIVETLADQIEHAKTLPPAQRLIGNFLLKGDLGIQFADVNVGKSIAATQQTNCIASGTDFAGLPNDCKQGLKCLMFELELDYRDLQLRYSNFKPHPNFKRIDKSSLINAGLDISAETICNIVREMKPDFICVDNVSAIAMSSTANSDEALHIIKAFDALKREMDGLTILLIDHTPKIESGKPLTANNLAGSKKMQIFLDSLIGIGQDHTDISCRYFKQLKTRAGERMEQVLHAQLTNDPYLHFEFLQWIDENELLPKISEENPIRNRYIAIVDEYFDAPIRMTDFANKFAENTGKSVSEGERIFYKLRNENLIVKDFNSSKWRRNENGVLKLNEPQQLNEGDEGDEIVLSDSINF